MIEAFTAAVRQLDDPAIRRVLVRVALWTAAIYVGLAVVLSTIPGAFDAEAYFADIQTDWIRHTLVWVVGHLVTMLIALAFVAVLWILFVAIVQTVSSFYFEDVIVAVEARHYPKLPKSKSTPLVTQLHASLRFAGKVILLNLLALPFYLIPVVSLVVFLGLNGYLVGREYFELAALRRLDFKAANALRKSQSGRVFGAGVIITALFAVPLVNLLAPVIGAAFMVHIFESMRAPATTP